MPSNDECRSVTIRGLYEQKVRTNKNTGRVHITIVADEYLSTTVAGNTAITERPEAPKEMEPAQPPSAASRIWRFVTESIIKIAVGVVIAILGAYAISKINFQYDQNRFPTEKPETLPDS